MITPTIVYFLSQLPVAIYAVLALGALLAVVYLVWRRLRATEKPSAGPVRPHIVPSVSVSAVTSRVVALSESRMVHGLDHESVGGMVRRPGLGYHPQRFERRIVVLR
jgi:hypothetical protein